MRCIASTILLSFPLILASCGGGDSQGGASTAEGAESPSEQPPGDPQPASGAGSVEVDSALTGGRTMDDPGAPSAPGAPAPNRFDPGGEISDAELANYYPTVTCAVDGNEIGTMSFSLWPEAAPITVRNFLRLCDSGFYEGVPIHRIMRQFMVQGGDPTGTGTGNSPYGMILGEFSDDPARAHGYGVISMARGGDPNSASCQFFVCADDTQEVWALDGQYASFGRLTKGVAALEALADVPVSSTGRENSSPNVPVTIVSTAVLEGEPPSGETITRPYPDIGDEPEEVTIQLLVVSFQGVPRSPATRTREEAEQLAAELIERARAGEDFGALVVANSDLPSDPADETPAVFRFRNFGVRDVQAERAIFAQIQAAQEQLAGVQAAVQGGEMTPEAAQLKYREVVGPIEVAQEAQGVARGNQDEVLGNLIFSLGVGEVGVIEYDANASPIGWQLIKRLE